eukprot:5041733-Amphidinium_carterae.1
MSSSAGSQAGAHCLEVSLTADGDDSFLGSWSVDELPQDTIASVNMCDVADVSVVPQTTSVSPIQSQHSARDTYRVMPMHQQSKRVAKERGVAEEAELLEVELKASQQQNMPGTLMRLILSTSRASDVQREGTCGLCNEQRQLVPKQAYCTECLRDLECMRRDSKAAGSKHRANLKQWEKDPETLKTAWSNWKGVVGDRNGNQSRIGLYDWARLEDTLL